MRVVYTNRNHAHLSGGDSYKIGKYREGLPKLGIETAYTYTPHYTDLSVFDIIHNFHLGHDFSYKFTLEAKRLGKPLVMSPIFFPDMGLSIPYRIDTIKY